MAKAIVKQQKRKTGKSKSVKLEVQAKISLMDVVDVVGDVGELIEISDHLLKGILQDLGPAANDACATTIAVLAVLEKAARMQEQVHEDAHALFHRLRDAGVVIEREEASHE